MARPKGSKNAVRTKKANIDYAAIVAEKTAAKEQIETEIAALSDNITFMGNKCETWQDMRLVTELANDIYVNGARICRQMKF